MRGHHNILLLFQLIYSVKSRGLTSQQFFSPVSELGPSLAASVAGGTIIAVKSHPSQSDDYLNGVASSTIIKTNDTHDDDDEKCLVILFRSPIVDGTGSGQRSDDRNLTLSYVFGNQVENKHSQIDHYCGLSFLANGPVNFPFLPCSSRSNLRVLHAPSGLVLAATGFVPDADHILNVAAGRIYSRISIYDAPSSPLHPSSTKSVDPHKLVREDLSPMMMDATMSGGGRPFGVQLLVVGQSALSRNTSHDSALEIYTIDPSGGWRTCVGSSGTAVGRGAERIRAILRKNTSIEPIRSPRGWRGALDTAMMVAIEAFEQDETIIGDNSEPQCGGSSANFGAIVIFSSLRNRIRQSRCALVNSIVTMESYERCHKQIINKTTPEKRT